MALTVNPDILRKRTAIIPDALVIDLSSTPEDVDNLSSPPTCLLQVFRFFTLSMRIITPHADHFDMTRVNAIALQFSIPFFGFDLDSARDPVPEPFAN